jgi:hypothetical protein
VIFITKNIYLSGKNSVRFIPQQGKAAKRYARLVCAQTTLFLSECFLPGNFVDLLCPGRIFSNRRITAAKSHGCFSVILSLFFLNSFFPAEKNQVQNATTSSRETLATSY